MRTSVLYMLGRKWMMSEGTEHPQELSPLLKCTKDFSQEWEIQNRFKIMAVLWLLKKETQTRHCNSMAKGCKWKQMNSWRGIWTFFPLAWKEHRELNVKVMTSILYPESSRAGGSPANLWLTVTDLCSHLLQRQQGLFRGTSQLWGKVESVSYTLQNSSEGHSTSAATLAWISPLEVRVHWHHVYSFEAHYRLGGAEHSKTSSWSSLTSSRDILISSPPGGWCGGRCKIKNSHLLSFKVLTQLVARDIQAVSVTLLILRC